MKRRVRSIWERLAVESSVEGPTVTISLPREVAQELVGVLMGSLELDGGGLGDEDPDGDDIDGMPDGEDDGSDPLAALIGGDDDGGGGIPGLDDGPEDEPDDDDSDDDDRDDDKDEAADYRHSGGNPSGLRTQTALGERRRRELRRR